MIRCTVVILLLINFYIVQCSSETIYQVPKKPIDTSTNDDLSTNEGSNDDISRSGDSNYNPTLSPSYIQGSPTNRPTYIQGSPTYIEGYPTNRPSYIEGYPTNRPSYIQGYPTNRPSYIQGYPTNRPSYIQGSTSLAPTYYYVQGSPTTAQTLQPTTAQTKDPSLLPSLAPTTPSNNNPVLITVSNVTYEFYIYNSTINSQSKNVISSAVLSIFNAIDQESKITVSINNNMNKKYSRLLREGLDLVYLNLACPFKNVRGDPIDAGTATNMLIAAVSQGTMQQAIRNTSKTSNDMSLRWVVVCMDELCSDQVEVQSSSNEACSKDRETLYDRYYGWDKKPQGYLIWLLILVMIWFGLSVLIVSALFSRYYYGGFHHLRDIKICNSFCFRSTHLTLQSILETSKFLVGCLIFNLCISRMFALLMIVILTTGTQFVKNFACIEFSIIRSNSTEDFSKFYVIIYTCFYPLLLLATIGRQIWHDAELRNVGFVHLLADSRMHLAIAMVLRKIAGFIAVICLSLLLILLLANIAMTSTETIKAVQTVQLVCSIFIILIQSYRTYGARNIKLEIRSPLDSFNQIKRTRLTTNVINRNSLISSPLDDVKDDYGDGDGDGDDMDRLERLDDSEKTEDPLFQPHVSDNLTITLTLLTSCLSIITSVPYLFSKALLALIVFSIITRISEIFTVISLISTFKVHKMSLQQLISRELRERVNRVLKSSSLSSHNVTSSVTNMYRPTFADVPVNDYLYHEDCRSDFNEDDHQSLISDLTSTTKHPFYMQPLPIQDKSQFISSVKKKNTEIKKQSIIMEDGVPKWIKKWETSESIKKSSKNQDVYDDLEMLMTGRDNRPNEGKIDIDNLSLESTASSFGSHWNNIVTKCKEMSINRDSRDGRESRDNYILRTSKLEM